MLEKTNKRPLAFETCSSLGGLLCLFLHICDNCVPPPFRYLFPMPPLLLLSAAKVNGDEQAHQRLDVVAAEQ